MTEFEILITSPPDREYLVAEIWHSDELIAEINHEQGSLRLEFYFKEKKVFNLKEFCEALDAARERLLAGTKSTYE